MKEILAVFIGGGLGSLARLGISKTLVNYANSFPVGTFIANLLSCIIVGVLVTFMEEKIIISPAVKGLLIVGFCGGFSTFSTLIRESLLLLEHNRAGPMIAYALLSMVLGLTGMIAGIWLGKLFIR